MMHLSIPPFRLRCPGFLLGLLLSLPSDACFTQDANSLRDGEQKEQVATTIAAETLTEERLAVATERQQLQLRLESLERSDSSEELAQSLAWQLEMVKYLELLYAQHEGALLQQKELADEGELLRAELQLLRSAGPVETKPYSFLLFDELQDQLATEQGRSEAIQEEIRVAQGLLESVREKLQDDEAGRRHAEEAYEAVENKPDRSARQTEWEQAKLMSRVAQQAVVVRRLELDVARQKYSVAQLRCRWLEEKVNAMSGDVVFSAQDLTACLTGLASDEQEIQAQISELQTELPQTDERWRVAKQRNEQQGGSDPALLEQLNARQLEREVLLERISLLEQRLGLLTLARYAWERRYRAANSLIPVSDLHSELSELDGFRERQQQTRELVEIRLRELRLELSSLDKRRRTEKQRGSEAVPWLELQYQLTQRLVSQLATNLVRQDAVERLLQKTAADMGERAQGFTARDRLTQFGDWCQDCWTYEIAAVDDRPITVGKLVLGALFLLLGYVVSRLLSRVVGRRIFTRLGMTPGAASAVQTISFYILLTVFGFLSLELANVPLTIFTFLGGAVAIGVGFGS